MSLPAGFTVAHYREVPMAFAGPDTRRLFRRMQQKAWAGQETVRCAIAGDSLMTHGEISRINRVCGQIFGNAPETQWFGGSTGSVPSPSRWTHRLIDHHLRQFGWSWREDVIPDPTVIPWPVRSSATSPTPSICISGAQDTPRYVINHSLNGRPNRASHYGEPAIYGDFENGVDVDVAIWGPTGSPGDDFDTFTRINMRTGMHGLTSSFGQVQTTTIAQNAPQGAQILSRSITPDTSDISGWPFDTARHYQLNMDIETRFLAQTGNDTVDLKIAALGSRIRFANPAGMAFHQFSRGGERLDQWLTDNTNALPLWWDKLGPFDCFIQTHAVNVGGTPNHDDFYDSLHEFVDLIRSISSDAIIWLHPPHYTRRSISGDDETVRAYKEGVASVFHLVAQERDCLFFNTPRWLDERFGYRHETQTRDDPPLFDPETSYDRGDVVMVEHDESTNAPMSPEARGREGLYICIQPLTGSAADPISASDWPGHQRYWTRIDWGGPDNIHLSERVEEERYRILAGLLAGTFGGPPMQRDLGAGDRVHRVIGEVAS